MFIFFACLFSLIALIIAFKLHDKYDPARYFLLMWGGQILLIYTIFHNLFTFTGYGLAFISMMCLTFSTGSLTGQFIGNRIPPDDKTYTFKSKRALLFLHICLILAILNVLQGIYANGFNIREILSFNVLMELNSAAAESRYTTNEQTTMLSQLSLIFVYLTPLYGGYLLPLLQGHKKIGCYLSVLPALLISLTQAVKLGFITSIVLFATGIIISSYANNHSFFRIGKATILKIFLFSMLFFAILFLSMIFRTGKFDLETAEYIGDKFLIYAFGHLPVFDQWFTQNIGELIPNWGIKTFFGISNFFGIAERKQGIFTEFIYFGKNNFKQIPPEMGSNIYTLFRFILEDFGFLGSILMMFATSVLSGFSWLMVKRQKNNLIFQTLLISVFFFLFMSFAISVWAFTSYIATIILFYFLLFFSFSKPDVKLPLCQPI